MKSARRGSGDLISGPTLTSTGGCRCPRSVHLLPLCGFTASQPHQLHRKAVAHESLRVAWRGTPARVPIEPRSALPLPTRMTRYTRHAHNEESREFDALLGRFGRKLTPIQPDGNCLFRAIAHQVYGSEARHREVRALCCDFLLEHEQDFIHFLAPGTRSSYARYVKMVSRDGTWGGHLEMVALARAFQKRVAVYRLGEPEPTWVVDDEAGGEIHLVYHERGTKHYSSATTIALPESAGMGGGTPSTDRLSEVVGALTLGQDAAEGTSADETPPTPRLSAEVAPGREETPPGATAEGLEAPADVAVLDAGRRWLPAELQIMPITQLKILFKSVMGHSYRGPRWKRLLISPILDAWRIEDMLRQSDLADDDADREVGVEGA